jgi:excinuclease ABC subunit A
METIRIRGARTHNLRNVSLDIPRNKLVVVSARLRKSSLAFDTLYAEGQRRYVECAPVPQLMEKPDVDLRGPVAGDAIAPRRTTRDRPRAR